MVEAPIRFSRIELWIQSALRVPTYPEPPEGMADSIQVFHAGRNYYKLRVFIWFLSHAGTLAGLAAGHVFISKWFAGMPGWAMIWLRLGEWIAILGFIASAVFTFFCQRLDYLLRWYIVTDRSLRIRTGVIGMQEITMTFSNIQEIRVTAGPLQNILKIADVEVKSAGGATKGGADGHIGRFHSVSNANVIRDLMVERLRQYRDSGLGEPVAPGMSASDHTMNAARAVLDEARALRERLTSRVADKWESAL